MQWRGRGEEEKKNGELSVRSQLPPLLTTLLVLVLHPWRDNEHLALPAHYITTTASNPPRSRAIQPLRSGEAVAQQYTSIPGGKTIV